MSTSSDKSSTPTEAGIPVNDLLQQLKVLEQAQDAASIQAVATKLRSLLNVNTSSTQGQGLNPSSERKTEGNQSTQTAQLVYICGDESGVGKTTVCMGLLASALDAGYTAKDLAYIKPCTQCEDVQLLWKWCDAMGIECRGIGPILFRPGYTGEVIKGGHGTAQDRLDKIKEAVDELAKGRRLVIVDGVGYPGVGSCVGTSNAQVAHTLNAPVILVGRPGVGNAIDSTVMATEYLLHHHVKVLGAIWNKIPRKVTYHTYDKCKEMVTEFFKSYQPQVLVFGHIPLMTDDAGNEEVDAGSCRISCSLRKPSKTSLAMTDEDVKRADKCNAHFMHYVNYKLIFDTISLYWNNNKPN